MGFWRTAIYALSISWAASNATLAQAEVHGMSTLTSSPVPRMESGNLQFAQRYRPPIRRPSPRAQPRPGARVEVKPTIAEMRAFNEMSQAGLYAQLAAAVTGQLQIGSDGVEKGQRYFWRLLPHVQSMVCGSSALKSFLTKGDVFSAASLIAEMISARFKLPKGTASMAVLAARMGFNELCPNGVADVGGGNQAPLLPGGYPASLGRLI